MTLSDGKQWKVLLPGGQLKREKKKKITSPNDTAMLAKTHTVFNLISKKYDLAHRNLGPILEK